MSKTFKPNPERIKNSMPVHEFAHIPPPMHEEQFHALVNSIAQIGLQEPIMYVVVEGQKMILDGVHRDKACQYLSGAGGTPVSPRYEELKGDNILWLNYVLGKNAARRHVMEKERVKMCVSILEAVQEAEKAGEEKHEAGSTEKAAQAAGVSPRTAARVKEVLKSGNKEVKEAMKSGKVKPATAAKLARKGMKASKKILDKVLKGKAEKASPKAVAKASQEVASEVDDAGKPVPFALRKTFRDGDLCQEICNYLGKARKGIRDLARGPLEPIIKSSLHASLDSIEDVFKAGRPAWVCQACDGNGEKDDKKCAKCNGKGYHPNGDGEKPTY